MSPEEKDAAITKGLALALAIAFLAVLAVLGIQACTGL